MKRQDTLTKPMLTLVIAALATSPTFLAGCSSTQSKPNSLAIAGESSLKKDEEQLMLPTSPLASTDLETPMEAPKTIAKVASTKQDLEAENESIAELLGPTHQVDSSEDTVLLEIETTIKDIAEAEFEQPNKTTFKFGFDKKQLPAEDMEIIAQHGRFLSQNPAKKIQIHGHADAQGAPLYNQYLAKQRANHVAEILELQGVAADQIEVISWGSDKPKANGSHWKDHRRVEMIYEESSYDENIVAQSDVYPEPSETTATTSAIESIETVSN
ncbi:MAG: OmpA family protein [Pseudomonadales bacterium]|nr:OmpA family protein [Pseudomonadales bacterium]